MGIIWTVLVYALTIAVLSIATRIAPRVFVPIVLLYKAITKQEFLHSWHPAFVFINVVASCAVVEIAILILKTWGYATVWPLPVSLILINLYVGALPSMPTKAMSYSIVIAMLIILARLPFRH